MVHNGIEYGIMAAYAEGFNILHHADVGKREPVPRRRDGAAARPASTTGTTSTSPQVAEVWRRGSVVASWLLDLRPRPWPSRPDLKEFAGRVSDSGEGRWTVHAAVDEGVPANVLSAALFERFTSRGEADFAEPAPVRDAEAVRRARRALFVGLAHGGGAGQPEPGHAARSGRAARARVPGLHRTESAGEVVGPQWVHGPRRGSRCASRGSYRIAMQPPDGDLFYLTGEFREVDPPARLAYTFRWEDPDPDDRETVVTLSFGDPGNRPSWSSLRARLPPSHGSPCTGTVGQTASSDYVKSCRRRHRSRNRRLSAMRKQFGGHAEQPSKETDSASQRPELQALAADHLARPDERKAGRRNLFLSAAVVSGPRLPVDHVRAGRGERRESDDEEVHDARKRGAPQPAGREAMTVMPARPPPRAHARYPPAKPMPARYCPPSPTPTRASSRVLRVEMRTTRTSEMNDSFKICARRSPESSSSAISPLFMRTGMPGSLAPRTPGSCLEPRERGSLSLLVYTTAREPSFDWRAKAMRSFHSVGAISF